MVTELMLILIVVGAGIVFIVWSNSRKRQKSEQDRREVEESTNKFKLELEKTANEIIGRMESQAAHLENLLDDSERNRTQLEGRVMELKKLLKRSEGQSTEIRDLLERLDDAVDDVNEMQKQMDAVERKINAAINVQIPPPPVLNSMPQIVPPLINPLIPQTSPVTQQNVQTQTQAVQPPQPPQPSASPITPPQILRTPAPATPPPVQPQTPPVVQPVTPPQEDFSKVLEKSMAEGNLQTAQPEIQKTVQSATKSQPLETQKPRRRIAKQNVANVTGSIAERQARVLAERQSRSTERIVPVEVIEQKPPTPIVNKRSEKIRQAAVDAINNAVEQENTIDVELSPIEELQSNKKIQSLKTKASTLGKETPETSPAKIVDSNADSANIRDMLLSGMTVEEISKETGLGRGAIELVQQMARRQLERR